MTTMSGWKGYIFPMCLFQSGEIFINPSRLSLTAHLLALSHLLVTKSTPRKGMGLLWLPWINRIYFWEIREKEGGRYWTESELCSKEERGIGHHADHPWCWLCSPRMCHCLTTPGRINLSSLCFQHRLEGAFCFCYLHLKEITVNVSFSFKTVALWFL